MPCLRILCCRTVSAYGIPVLRRRCHLRSADRGDSREVQTPRVVLEALSPSTERNDRTEKFALVRSCPSVQEYVLVWTRYQCVEVYRRAEPAWTVETYWPGNDVMLQCVAVRFPLASLYEDTEVPTRPEEAP